VSCSGSSRSAPVRGLALMHPLTAVQNKVSRQRSPVQAISLSSALLNENRDRPAPMVCAIFQAEDSDSNQDDVRMTESKKRK